MPSFWPNIDEVRDAPWSADPIWTDGPSYGDLIAALTPAIRALFLLGYKTLSVNVSLTEGSGESTDWTSIELDTLISTTEMLPFDRPYDAVNIAFDVENLFDPTLKTNQGYGMARPSEVIGFSGPLPTDGLLPDALVAAIDAFVDGALTTLTPTFPSGGKPARTSGGGAAWLFDAASWSGVNADVVTLMTAIMADQGDGFLRSQLKSDVREDDPDAEAGPPNLVWLCNGSDVLDLDGRFARALYQSLQQRGQSEILTHSLSNKLFGSGAPCWLDVLGELFARGAILVDGLFAPADAVAPLVAETIWDTEVRLTVWGETRITLYRVNDSAGATAVKGSAAWEHVAGNDKMRPRVMLVVGRGIAVDYAKLPKKCRWDLEIYRVQTDDLVPREAAAIDPSVLLAATLVEPDVSEYDEDHPTVAVATGSFPKLMRRYKADGVYLEFPIFGSNLPAPEDMAVRDPTMIPMSIDVTVDPTSGEDAYGVDVHYHTYVWGAATLGVAHICVWATPGVKITCNDSPGDNSASPTGVDNGAISTLWSVSSWAMSAEFWQVDAVDSVPAPWGTMLPVTDALVYQSATIKNVVPRLSGTNGSDTTTYGGVKLTRKAFTHQDFKYYDSLMLDALAIAIGFIPIVGDIVDIGQCVYAWQTGRDMWGRPVTNFQLAVMTIGAAVPILSGSFIEKVTEWVSVQPSALLVLHGSPLSLLFKNAATDVEVTEHEIEAAVAASRTWTSSSIGTAAKADMVESLGTFIAENPDVIKAYAARITEQSGDEWLALPDIVNAETGRFRVSTVQDGYARYLITHPTATPEEYLTYGARGKARAVAQALLGNLNVGVARLSRTAAQCVMYPSDAGRALIAGTPKAVAEITGDSLSTSVGTAIQAAIDEPTSMKLMSSGAIVDATRAVDVTADMIRADADALIANAPSLGELVGGDLLNGRAVSLDERAHRFAKALLIARNEASSVLLDPSILSTDAMRDALRDFVYAFITRHGFEWGPRFELRLAADIHASLLDQVSGIVHQLSMPDIAGRLLVSGPDHVLYNGGLAYTIQAKAYRTLDSLVAGSTSFDYDAMGALRKVRGPNLIAQTIKDTFRRTHWSNWLPGPGVVPTLALPSDPAAAGWVRAASKHAIVIDDIYLQNTAFNLLSEAALLKGRRTIDVLADVQAPLAVREMLKEGLGPTVQVGSSTLSDDLAAWLLAMAPEIEGDVNRAMADPEITKVIGTGNTYVVKLASQGVDDLPKLLWGGS